MNEEKSIEIIDIWIGAVYEDRMISLLEVKLE